MIASESVVLLSRWQFGLTALYHFLFVPLTLGLSNLLGIMETIYFITNRPIWKIMTQYWGLLLGINIAMGVATGVTLEFQFGTNWAYYSQFVGDVFGLPVALEGLIAFFLESTLIGLFFFGWDKLTKGAHLMVTWLLALGASASALWILVANGWMQSPVGSSFNFHTMRMELNSFYDLFFNPVAQAKFVHTISAGYVTGSMFVLSVSAWFLLNKRNIQIAKRSFLVAAAFGLASALSVVVLGDQSGYVTSLNQKMKIAAIESEWETQTPPAAFTAFGIPDQTNHTTRYQIKIPFILGLIATRSITEPVYGIKDLVTIAHQRILDGRIALKALTELQKNPQNKKAEVVFNQHQQNLGYGLLLKKYTDDIDQATNEMIQKAAWDTVPSVPILFWTFRMMAACGFYFILLFGMSYYFSIKNRLEQKKWFLRVCLWSLPLPWLASSLGWIVAEMGRQPWVVEGQLPTFLAASTHAPTDLWISISGFVFFYTVLAIIEVYLMLKYIKLGPEGSHIGNPYA